MNVSSIIYFCSQILGIEGVLMALPCIVAVIYGERQGLAFLPVMAVCIQHGKDQNDKMHLYRPDILKNHCLP